MSTRPLKTPKTFKHIRWIGEVGTENEIRYKISDQIRVVNYPKIMRCGGFVVKLQKKNIMSIDELYYYNAFGVAHEWIVM